MLSDIMMWKMTSTISFLPSELAIIDTQSARLLSEVTYRHVCVSIRCCTVCDMTKAPVYSVVYLRRFWFGLLTDQYAALVLSSTVLRIPRGTCSWDMRVAWSMPVVNLALIIRTLKAWDLFFQLAGKSWFSVSFFALYMKLLPVTFNAHWLRLARGPRTEGDYLSLKAIQRTCRFCARRVTVSELITDER